MKAIHAWWLSVIPIGFLIIFLIYPFVRLLSQDFSFENFQTTWQNPYYQSRLWWTFGQALGSTVFTMLLGVPAAVVFARYEFRSKRTLEAVLTLPFVVPIIVATMGFLALFGTHGFTGINLSNSAWLIVFANVFYNYALVVRLVSSYLSSVGMRFEEAARVCGSSTWRAFWRITLPMAQPAIFSSSGLVFLYTFASFGVPLVLGGGRFNTLEVEAYTLVVNQLRIGEAGALALVQLVVTGLAILFYTRWQSRSSIRFEIMTWRPKARGWSRVWLGLNIVLALVITVTPLMAVMIQSIWSANGLTVSNYVRAFQASDGLFVSSVPEALQNSVGFAAGTLLTSIPLGLLYALVIWRTKSKLLDALSLLPLAVSAALLGTAYLIAFPHLRASLVIVFAAYTLVAYPFVTRASLSALRAISPNALEAARVLGSNPLRVFWRVTLPFIAPALMTGMAFAFASVIGEFGASLVLTRPEWTTLSGAILERLGRPGKLGEASALATLLLVFTTVGFLLLARGSKKN